MSTPDLERRTPYRDELAWMPPSVLAARRRRQRRVIFGSLWMLLLWACVLGLILISGLPVLLLKILSPVPIGILLLGGRLYRSDERRQALALAQGITDASELKAQRLVHLRGTVRARPGAAHLGTGVVMRRMVIAVSPDSHTVYEVANDFDLIDGAGKAVRVRVANARLVAPEALALVRPSDLPDTAPVGDVWQDDAVSEGQLVDVIGCPDWSPDATAERLAREEASTPSLRDGGGLPLLVTIAEDHKPPDDNWPLGS